MRITVSFCLSFSLLFYANIVISKCKRKTKWSELCVVLLGHFSIRRYPSSLSFFFVKANHQVCKLSKLLLTGTNLVHIAIESMPLTIFTPNYISKLSCKFGTSSHDH